MKTNVVICEDCKIVERAEFEKTLTILVESAKTKITIISPYFTYRSFTKILEKASNEVSIDIVISESPEDQLYVNPKLLLRCHDLGCKIFSVQNLHAKIYLADEKKAIVGSTNLTTASITYRWECGILIEKRDILNAVITHIKAIMKNSRELSIEDIKQLEKIGNQIKKKNKKNEEEYRNAEKQWSRYINQKPPERALLLTIDGDQYEEVLQKRRSKFAVIKNAYFPSEAQTENIQRRGKILSNRIPVLFYVRKGTDENSDEGFLIAKAMIPPYGYHTGYLHALKIFKTRHFGDIPMLSIEKGQESINNLPRQKRQKRLVIVMEDFHELQKIQRPKVEAVLHSLKKEYDWIGEGMVKGPSGRYIPIKGYQMLIKEDT